MPRSVVGKPFRGGRYGYRDRVPYPPLPYAPVAPLPQALQVEVTSACNLRCAMCLVAYRPPVNKITGAMPLSMLQGLVDELPELRELTLQGLGEPLLSPHLMQMVRYAKERGIRVGFNSNATLLTGRRSRELVEVGLDWLHTSLDGADRATFEGIRVGASFNEVLRNLSGLAAAKRAAGADRPQLRVVFVAMRRNVAQLPDLVALLAGIGVDDLRVQNLSHSFADTDPAGAYQEIRTYAEGEALWQGEDREAAATAFAAARAAAAKYGVALRLPSLDPPPADHAPRNRRDGGHPGCTWPWDAAYVTSTGQVQPCCMVMGDDRVSLGSLSRESFASIWNGPAYQQFRRALHGTRPPKVCEGCALYRGTF
ncbi:MAG: SPASM domain-containing protein [Micromonosporaceae bacterium]|nr:SPASM domain-containing protein [Micromonosporaceae bacterium]